jgi:hypothetical protein
LHGLEYDHGIIMSCDSLRHIVHSMTTLKSVVGIPKDSERLAVDASEIDAWYNILSEKLLGVSRRFVFNVDETGCLEHIDSHEVTIVVPVDYPDPSVPVPVNRHTERSTLTACIAADGYWMKPFLIVDRATVEAEMGLYGYDSPNVFLASQENAFMTTRLFELWARKVFFPAVAQRRAEIGYTGMAFLLLDGLGFHHTDEFLQTCAGQDIDILFLGPHSSDQTQPLDVLTFALMKRHFSVSRFSRLENPQSNRFVRILGAWIVERVKCPTSQHRSLPEDWAGPIRGTLEVWAVLPEGATRGGPMCPTMARTGGGR